MGLILDGTAGISASGNITGGNIIVTGNFSPSSLSVVGNVQGAYILGNGSTLSSITGANVTGTVSAATTATTAATVTTGAQPNITSVGTLSSLTVTANVTGGNILTGGLVSATGNVTGAYVIGNGVALTNLTGANVTGTVGSATTAATVTTAAQPNITSVGTLSSLSVTGNINGGNITTVGTASLAGFTISGNTITSQGATLTIDPNASGGVDGNVVIQGNLVVNGNMTYINSNNITTNDLTINMANNAATATAANGGGIGVGPAGSEYISLTYNSSSNIWVASNGLSVQGVVQTAGNISGGNVLTGGLLSVTGNVTGGNVLTGGLLSVTGNVTGGNLSVGTGTITVGNIVNSNGNGVGNIGNSTIYFNTIFAKATSAQYADLAEKYSADAEYAPGTVVSFGGTAEVTQSTVNGDRRVAGVVSTNPSYIMNSGLEGTVATVALTGRVPTRVTGSVRKGDLMVSNGDGSARAEDAPATGSVIGKSLVDFDGETGTIEIVVGRL